MQDTKKLDWITWDQEFTEAEWKKSAEHAEKKGQACNCKLCQKIRLAIQREVRRPLRKGPKKKETYEKQLKEWKEIPMEAFQDYSKHKVKCECPNCMKIKNFFGQNKELEKRISRYE